MLHRRGARPASPRSRHAPAPPLSVLAALALGAATVSIGSPALAAPADEPAPLAGPNGYTPPPITWTDCSEQYTDGFECGRVVVPLDWADTGGEKISLAVTRLKHTVEPYQGVMLVNPGGPGGSGTIYPVLQGVVPKGAGQGYDWIGFDTRGVGDSEPRLNCVEGFANGVKPPYVPRTKAIENAWRAKAADYATQCGAKNGPILAHMHTVDIARDMDTIRAALGQEQLNYYGFSYGTSIGQNYSTLFPSHVRRMVFDGTVDGTRNWVQSNFDQDVAFQKSIEVFFGWVAKYNRVYHLGSSRKAVERRYYTELARLDKHPQGDVGGSEWNDIFLIAGYYQPVWPDVAEAFAGWANDRDQDALQNAYESFVKADDDNGYAVYDAVTCSEAPWPSSYATYERDTERVYKKAPFETWGNSWFNAPCLTWPVGQVKPLKIDGSKVQSVLMINETLDGATPYSGSLVVRKLFPGARLIAEPGGTSHANSLAGNSCVDDRIADYLATGKLPARKRGNQADVLCKPLPQPKPTVMSPSARSAQKTPLQQLKEDTLKSVLR